jgi:hypothetical protein
LAGFSRKRLNDRQRPRSTPGSDTVRRLASKTQRIQYVRKSVSAPWSTTITYSRVRKQTTLDSMLRHLASSATPKALSGALGHFKDRRGSRMQSLVNCDNLSVFEDGDMGDVIRVDFRQRWHNAVFVMTESGKTIEITGPGQACGYLMRSLRTRSGPVYLTCH